MKKLVSIFLTSFIAILFSTSAIASGTAQYSITSTSTSSAKPIILKPTTVATVDIYNAKILLQRDREFALSFDISNQVGVQSQIKYAVKLVRNGITSDEHVYADSFSLGENTSLRKTLNYIVPSVLSAGAYELWLESNNSSGLPLAVADLGEINIGESSGQSIQILPDSCYTVLSDDSSMIQYKTNQSPSLSGVSVITLHCNVMNSFDSDTVVMPTFETRRESVFGDNISQAIGSQDSITLHKGINAVSVQLPKISVPQHYVVSFSLNTSDPLVKSNTIISNYFFVGETGTIHNVVLDKAHYASGDIAKLQIYETAAGTGDSSSIISTLITDEMGQDCSAVLDTTIPHDKVISTVSVPISRDCINAQAHIKLSVKRNNGTIMVLDDKDFGVIIKKDTPFVGPLSNVLINKIVTLVFSLIIIILAFLFYKKRKTHALKVFVIVFFICGTFLGFGKHVSAATTVYSLPNYDYAYDRDNNQHVSFYYSITYPTIIHPNETIPVSATVSNNNSNSSVWPVQTIINNIQIDSAGSSFRVECDGPCGPTTNSLTFPAIATQGAHNFTLMVAHVVCNAHYESCGNYWVSDPGYVGTQTYAIPFSVIQPLAVITATPNPILINSTSSLAWNSLYADYCTITKNGAAFLSPIAYNYTWTNCSGEGGYCGVGGGVRVRYGGYGCVVSGLGCYQYGYNYWYVDVPAGYPGWSCTNGAFGGDPLPGTQKSCDYYAPQAYIANPYLSGATTTGILSATTTYAISCNFRGQVAATSSIVLGVSPAPIAYISVSTSSVGYGGSTFVNWNATNANTCSVDEGNILGWRVSASSSSWSDPLFTTTIFKATCLGLNNSQSTASRIVTVGLPGTGGAGSAGNPIVLSTGNCTLNQVGSSQGNIYAGILMTWGVSLPANLINVVKTNWGGTDVVPTSINSSPLFTKIYSTIGQKNIFATTTAIDAGGLFYNAVCSATTTVRSGVNDVNAN